MEANEAGEALKVIMEFLALHDHEELHPPMTSSLISALTATTPGSDTLSPPVTDSEHAGLIEALGRIPDPRNLHGTRYPLVALLTVAVCGVLAGATSFAAIVDWLYDLDEQDQQRLGFTRGVPAGTTMWRLLTRLDPALLSAVLAGWLRSRTPPAPARPRRYRTVIAVDGKTLRGARLPAGRQVHLLSALDTSTGIVLAQVTVDTKSNEIPAFTPLLNAVRSPGQPDPGPVRRRRDAYPDRSHRADHQPWSTPSPAGKGEPAHSSCPAQDPAVGADPRSVTAPATADPAVRRPARSRPSPCKSRAGSPFHVPSRPSGSSGPAPWTARPARRPPTWSRP